MIYATFKKLSYAQIFIVFAVVFIITADTVSSRVARHSIVTPERTVTSPMLPSKNDVTVQNFVEARPYSWVTADHIKLLDAIEFVESNGDASAIGDSGNARGSFQIWEIYWLDAIEQSPNIGGVYLDVFNPDYARSIVLAYWDRYGHRVGYSLEGLARMHNGGPRGHEKSSTEIYWIKVSNLLN